MPSGTVGGVVDAADGIKNFVNTSHHYKREEKAECCFRRFMTLFLIIGNSLVKVFGGCSSAGLA